MIKSILSALFVSAMLAGSASAAPATFTDRTAFATAASVVALPLVKEDFEGATVGSTLTGPAKNFSGFTTTLTTTLSNPFFNLVGDGTSLNAGALTTKNLQIGLLGGDTFTLTFSQKIRAFGAVFANVNNGRVVLPENGGGVQLVDRSELLLDGVLAPWIAPVEGLATGFFGVVSDTAFTTVTIRGLFATEGMGMDDVEWAAARAVTPVPVPASGLLLAGVVLAAGAIGRRRRARA